MHKNEDSIGNEKLFWKEGKNLKNQDMNDCASIRDTWETVN